MKHVRSFSLTKYCVNVTLAASILCLNAPLALSEPLSASNHSEEEIIQEKLVNNTELGTLDYQSRYVMTKDKQGTYRTTYQSEKKEWFCCLNWFSSSKEKGEMEKSE